MLRMSYGTPQAISRSPASRAGPATGSSDFQQKLLALSGLPAGRPVFRNLHLPSLAPGRPAMRGSS